MPPMRRAAGEPPPAYGPNEPLFSVEMKHGGFFCGLGSNKCYVDGRTTYFDGCEVETWSPLWIKDFVQQLGHDPEICSVYWLLPGMGLDNGLRIVDRDRDTLNMSMVVPKFQHFTLYVDQPHQFDHIDLDDVAIDGSPPLPAVLSPKKSSNRHSTGTSPAVGAFKGVRRQSRAEQEVPIAVVLPSDSDDDDFVDSDNDIEDDDDLFDEWVDKDVEKGGKKKKRKKLEDSDYDTDELELPNSDDEDEDADADPSKKKKKLIKFTSFRPEDMTAPEFRMGMTFPSVVELRQALSQYSIQNRTVVKYEKNDLQRIRAHCGDHKCTWYIFAAPDNKKECFVVKKYTAKHTCESVWKLKVFTSNYLAKHYLNTFRADMKTTLENFANTVQKDFNMIPSDDKLRRARRLAMQEIHGDEVAQFNKLWDYAAEVRRSNPGSSMFINLKDGHFSQLYFSLYACKKGWENDKAWDKSCSVCSSTDHNKRKCPDLGRDEIPVPDVVPEAEIPVEDVMPPKRKMPVRRFSSSQQTFDDLGAQCSQTSMLDKVLAAVAPTQQSQAAPPHLPESSFIASSRDSLPLPRANVAEKKKGKPAAAGKKNKEKAAVAAKKQGK